MEREQIHDEFVSAFVDRRGEEPADLRDIERIERKLNTLLPQSFVDFLTRFGPGATINPRALVTSGETAVTPEAASIRILDFSSPHQIVMSTSKYRRGGLVVIGHAVPSPLVFGFREHTGDNRPNDDSVYIYDYLSGKRSEVAESFDAWLASFIELKGPRPRKLNLP